jgi:hypothetical protein
MSSGCRRSFNLSALDDRAIVAVDHLRRMRNEIRFLSGSA